MSIFLLLAAIGLLLALIFLAKLDAFLALLITAIAFGLSAGMVPADLLKSIQNGIGSTLGTIAPVLGLGVILGSLLTETGATQAISTRLLAIFGAKNAGLALTLTGFTMGIALFYNTGFVVLAPLVFSIAARSGQPLVPLAISMAAPLSVTHGFLPPHPGATAIAHIFGANLGKTLLFGLIIGFPAVLLGGWLFPKILQNVKAQPPEGFTKQQSFTEIELPHLGNSLLFALLPVLMMANAAVAEMALPSTNSYLIWSKFIGDPSISILLAVLAVLIQSAFKARSTQIISQLLQKTSTAVGAAAMLFLVIGAGGGFKQVLTDSGIAQQIANQMALLDLPPLLLAFLTATALRIAVGSATVAGMTAAGIVQPLLVINPGLSPELMTIAVGAGSLMCSHVNDTGFWMFREWFGLSIRDTFRSWTVMETIVGLVGLAGVLILNLFL
jgi:Gnt-I system high-affinity gluconate transporter/Gnt-II system L-idonate transporter